MLRIDLFILFGRDLNRDLRWAESKVTGRGQEVKRRKSLRETLTYVTTSNQSSYVCQFSSDLATNASSFLSSRDISYETQIKKKQIKEGFSSLLPIKRKRKGLSLWRIVHKRSLPKPSYEKRQSGSLNVTHILDLIVKAGEGAFKKLFQL